MKKILLLVFICTAFSAAAQTIQLDSGWQFRQAGKAEWLPATVPGTVHLDLMKQGLLPDPFYRDNESKVQWVEKAGWDYQTEFALSKELLSQPRIDLNFAGLDTEAEVFFNGTRVLTANNMFRGWTVNIKALAKDRNNLLIRFAPPSARAKVLKANEKTRLPENERIYIRKAQYQFGWDWGPRLVTCGIWQPVSLTAYTDRVQQAYTPIRNFQIGQKADREGKSFQLQVNGKPVYIRGANWIPIDNFIPRAQKLGLYRQRLLQAKEAHINMLRVWGGGIYETDEFYALCDSLNILVWQDFMFAGALYPSDPDFLKNIEAKVRYQVRRLRGHPSLAVWCGNNEIEEAWFNWGWQKQFKWSKADSARLWAGYRKVFHELIPRILREEDPGRPYWPSSPSLGWGRDSAYRKGDVHYWGVWWGKEPVEAYNKKVGRFNSEYGMQGMPDRKTIEAFTLPSDRDTSSVVMKVHQKHPFGWENIGMYIRNRFPVPGNFEDLVFVSQLMQADAMKTAIEAHRRAKPYNMGSLFWQWNDCWPVTSWSAVDYYGRKKALFYEVKRSFADLVILPYTDENYYYFRIVSELNDSLNCRVETDFIPFASPEKNTLKTGTLITVPPNGLFSGRSRRDTGKEFPKEGCMRFRVVQEGSTVAENYLFLTAPKELHLPKVSFSTRVSPGQIELQSDGFAYGVSIDVPDGVQLADNYFHLPAGEKKIIRFESDLPLEMIKQDLKVRSLNSIHQP